MPNGHGLRSRTRDTFSKGYRKSGVIPLTDTLRVFKIGDYVDVKVNSAVQAGMPHKFYHGKTGVVWNITKRAVGVEMNKLVSSGTPSACRSWDELAMPPDDAIWLLIPTIYFCFDGLG